MMLNKARLVEQEKHEKDQINEVFKNCFYILASKLSNIYFAKEREICTR